MNPWMVKSSGKPASVFTPSNPGCRPPPVSCSKHADLVAPTRHRLSQKLTGPRPRSCRLLPSLLLPPLLPSLLLLPLPPSRASCTPRPPCTSSSIAASVSPPLLPELPKVLVPRGKGVMETMGCVPNTASLTPPCLSTACGVSMCAKGKASGSFTSEEPSSPASAGLRDHTPRSWLLSCHRHAIGAGGTAAMKRRKLRQALACWWPTELIVTL
mmetsp:Transcript_30632/g.79779  ORF Transcript_30632/g.79779 Transcript_30632/m.79779 type:complete len:213 (+) Transcript_30632:1098-1736(+)